MWLLSYWHSLVCATPQARLPAVDGRDLYEAIVSGNESARGRMDALHLSPNAILKWPYKLLTGAQAFGVWTSPRYPNCSIANSADAGRGPEHSDTKVFNVRIPYGPPSLHDNVTWMFDCGYEPGCLFNLEEDPFEREDLAHSPTHSTIAFGLMLDLVELNRTLFKPDRGMPTVEACLQGVANGRFYGPFAHVPEGWYSPSPPPSRADLRLIHALRFVNRKKISSAIVNSMYALLPKIAFGQVFPTLDQCCNESISFTNSCTSAAPGLAR